MPKGIADRAPGRIKSSQASRWIVRRTDEPAAVREFRRGRVGNRIGRREGLKKGGQTSAVSTACRPEKCSKC
jgi:hypothetical protein